MKRFKLVDQQQDLTFTDVDEIYTGIGVIVNSGHSRIHNRILLGKTVDFNYNKPGRKFNYEDPKNNFVVSEIPYIIESVTNI